MKTSKYFLLLAGVLGLSAIAQANCRDSNGILRVGAVSPDPAQCNGEIARAAMSTCPEGTRLPTIRELIKIREIPGLVNPDSIAGPVEGIRELSQIPNIESLRQGNNGTLPYKLPTPDQGYKLVSVLKDSNKRATPDNLDEFYFNHDGYDSPGGDLANNWFWSSSVNSDFSNLSYYLSGSGGYVDVGLRGSGGGAVRCVPSR